MRPTLRRTNSDGALILLLLTGAATAAGPVSCHIHPPGSTPENPVNLIGPFDGYADCERERQRRFGAAGRCHCAADFSPRWLLPEIPSRPGDSPLG